MEDIQIQQATDSPPQPVKKGRIQACDRCRIRKRKCNGARPTCNNCEKAKERGVLEVECSYAEKKKRPRRQLRDVLVERLEALEALLRPLQEGGSPAAASTAAAARAEMAGIMQGLAGRRRSSQDDQEDSADDQDDDNDDNNNGHSPEMSLHQAAASLPSLMSSAAATPFSTTTSYSSPPPSDPPHSDDDFSESSPAMSITSMLGNDVPAFDAFSWPALIPRNVPLGSPELAFAIDPSTFLSSAQSSPAASNALAQAEPAELPHLFTHLIALYFAFINSCMPLFDESFFFSNLVPVNRHPPALLYAIYAYGCLHSRHPALFQKPYGNPIAASELFHAEATKTLDDVKDVITRLQVLIMLGKWSFGMNQPAKAFQYFSSAIQATERARLGFDRNYEPSRILALWGVPTASDPRHTLITLRTTWMFCFTADTMTSMAAELNPAMEESNYVHLLAEAVEFSQAGPDALADPMFSSEKGLWQQLLHGHPSYTIHDFRPNAWTPSIELLESHCDRTKPWFVQLQFLLRRIQRFTRSMPFDTRRFEGTSASLVFSVLPRPSGENMEEREQERLRLHNVLIEWWNTVPMHERAFEGLESFRDGRGYPPLPNVAQLASFQFAMMNAFYVAAFALLHHREGMDLEVNVDCVPAYSTCPSSDVPLATSSEILLLAIRAQAFLARSIYAMHGFETIPPLPPKSVAQYEGFGPSSPAPPLLLIQNPVTCYSTWCVGAAYMAMLSRRRNTNPGMNVQEGLDTVKNVFLPMLDSGRRVWAVMEVYANRLRDILEKVERGEEVTGIRAAAVVEAARAMRSTLRI